MTSSFKCYVDHSHTMYSSGNIRRTKLSPCFETRCIIFSLSTRKVGFCPSRRKEELFFIISVKSNWHSYYHILNWKNDESGGKIFNTLSDSRENVNILEVILSIIVREKLVSKRVSNSSLLLRYSYVTVLHLYHVPTMNVSWMFRRDGAPDSE